MGPVVIGYHGTQTGASAAILRDGFQPSRNRFDWIGDGAYFFQESPSRAEAWARELHGKAGVVLQANIDLDNCMDLLDSHWFHVLPQAHDMVVEQHRHAGLRLPMQSGGAHGVDRLVINLAVGILEQEGIVIRSVRAVFTEGAPPYPGSAFHDQSHIQIAVRDPTAISNIRILRVLGGGGHG